MSFSQIGEERLDDLLRTLEEATRAGRRSGGRFVEPAPRTLSRAKSLGHHIVFGRRGSGKSSLLIKAQTEFSSEKTPTAYVDLESYKEHSYPDVLVSILIAAIQGFRRAVTESVSTTSRWRRLFSKIGICAPTGQRLILKEITALESELQSLLFSQDGASIETLSKMSATQSETLEAKASFTGGVVAPEISAATTAETSQAKETKEQTQRSKIDFLRRSIPRFQHLFEQIAQSGTKNSAYLFLDDLYHIQRQHQASVLDYFHTISKGSGVWLKIGTIKHRTDHYKRGNPTVGMKLGDDANEINLDQTLEAYKGTKDFLFRVLSGLSTEVGIPSSRELFSEDAIDRLVIASGGVARDFLIICRAAIDRAREENRDKVFAEDVNRASNAHAITKEQELQLDTKENEIQIFQSVLNEVRDFARRTRSNCFLVDRDAQANKRKVIEELVDLKFLHLVSSLVTISSRPGKVYTGYMLDLSQYAQFRLSRVKPIRFWLSKSRGELRRASLIFDLESA